MAKVRCQDVGAAWWHRRSSTRSAALRRARSAKFLASGHGSPARSAPFSPMARLAGALLLCWAVCVSSHAGEDEFDQVVAAAPPTLRASEDGETPAAATPAAQQPAPGVPPVFKSPPLSWQGMIAA